ncbi:unnamed protein product [Rangifer tarandus platyrhynchus]|uniref:Uncharacterized protein n=2 Tax=Rangifer tarandus platyrhynchus TaxID=3082113 RepID=A0ABN8Z1M2_RANTA|nr:unnamed protein product [Rangifer tarandus platyrhynchus]
MFLGTRVKLVFPLPPLCLFSFEGKELDWLGMWHQEPIFPMCLTTAPSGSFNLGLTHPVGDLYGALTYVQRRQQEEAAVWKDDFLCAMLAFSPSPVPHPFPPKKLSFKGM